MARPPRGPNRLRATSASVCCPTTSRPRRIHPRRVSSSRSPVASATAVVRPFGSPRPAGSSRISRTSERRASAARRCSRSATFETRSVRARRPGRSTRSRSTERLVSNAPPMASASSSDSGVTTTSHSRRTPRATASTGSNVRERSTQATTEPAAWASATVRSASVVRPLDPSPRRATPAFRGSPPVRGSRRARRSRSRRRVRAGRGQGRRSRPERRRGPARARRRSAAAELPIPSGPRGSPGPPTHPRAVPTPFQYRTNVLLRQRNYSVSHR